MKYTVKELHQILMTKYEGKKVEPYGIGDVFYDVIRPILAELGYDNGFIVQHFCYSLERTTFELRYRTNMLTASRCAEHTPILQIIGKRKKGETNRYGTTYTWKDFDIILFGKADNFADVLTDAISRSNDHAKTSDDKVAEIYAMIREHFLDSTGFDLRQLVKIVADNWYTLTCRYEEKNKKS